MTDYMSNIGDWCFNYFRVKWRVIVRWKNLRLWSWFWLVSFVVRWLVLLGCQLLVYYFWKWLYAVPLSPSPKSKTYIVLGDGWHWQPLFCFFSSKMMMSQKCFSEIIGFILLFRTTHLKKVHLQKKLAL